MVAYIDQHRARFGVEPICRVLPIAPSSYYLAVRRRRSPELRLARAVRDEFLREHIGRVHHEHRDVYGARKVWCQLRREAVLVARCTVERLMRQMGLRGAVRGKKVRTTWPADVAERPQDLVERDFSVSAPNRLWVADLTYVASWRAFVYVAFVVDAYARTIVGWRVSSSLKTDLALDALEQALHQRATAPSRLVHHSDRAVQHLYIWYTNRLAKTGVEPSVGSKGDSYDNALAETIIGLYKTELIRRRGPWKSVEAVELATLDWIDGYNNRRLLGPPGYVPPAECEAQHQQRGACQIAA